MSPEKKRLYGIIIIVLFCLIIVTGIGNFRAKQLAVELVGDQVTKTLGMVSENLDLEKFQEIIKARDDKNSYYKQMRFDLMNLSKENNLENIYILYQDEKKMEWVYIVDARSDQDPGHNKLGQIEIQVLPVYKNTKQGKTVRAEYRTTSLGAFVSSYQGIKDSQGTVIAVLGGDFNAKEITSFLYLTKYVQIGIIVFSLFFIGGVIFFTRRKE